MIQLSKLPVAGLGIVAGGLLLGAGLGSYANPAPKAPPAPPWAGQLEPAIAVGETPISYQSYPEDLSPPNLANGYAPAVAFTQMRVPVDPPVPELDVRWKERWDAARPVARANGALSADDAPADRTVPHYAALEQSEASRATASRVTEDDNTPVNANADPASFRPKVDLADPPPLPVRAKMIHIPSGGGD